MTPIAKSSASFTYGGLTGPKAKLDFGTPIDGVIKSIDDKSANIYVHFMYEGSEDLLKQLDNELAKWEKSDLLIPYDTGSDRLALFRTKQGLTRAYIRDMGMKDAEVIDIDTGIIHLRAHFYNLYKIPNESTLRSFAPQAVPVYFKPYAETDLKIDSCLHEMLVRVKLQKGDSDNKCFTVEELEASLLDHKSMPLIEGLNKRQEFRTTSKKSQSRTTCFSDPYVQNTTMSTAVTTRTPGVSQDGMSHTLLTCIVVGSLICVIIFIIFLALYLYKRFGHVISERHRRAHHGHRRHRNESQQNSDGGSPSSSQNREPLPVPVEGATLPSTSAPNENVISNLPQYNISKESPHHTQVSRIFPMVMENSHSPNRAMTPLKTAEMSTQTQTCSATRSAEPLPDDDASSNKAQHSGSRMAAGSSSDLNEVTLQPSLKSSHRTSTLKSTRLPSTSSSFEIGRVSAPPHNRCIPIEKTRNSATRGVTNTNSDWKTNTDPTMVEDVMSESEEDEDDSSITRSVDDCERVLAAYKPPPTASAPVPISANRTKSHHSTRPLYSSTSDSVSHYTDNESAINGAHLMSLPERTSHRDEERRRIEYQLKQQDHSRISIPSDLLTSYTIDTLPSLHTAVSRRDSTVSWLADRTQSSMGRSMKKDEDFSL